jgi:hypothetical protein
MVKSPLKQGFMMKFQDSLDSSHLEVIYLCRGLVLGLYPIHKRDPTPVKFLSLEKIPLTLKK